MNNKQLVIFVPAVHHHTWAILRQMHLEIFQLPFDSSIQSVLMRAHTFVGHVYLYKSRLLNSSIGTVSYGS